MSPTYQYVCEKCGYSFERFHSIKKTLRKCPKCSLIFLKRKISGGTGFILKGSGFYCNDYPKENKDKNNS